MAPRRHPIEVGYPVALSKRRKPNSIKPLVSGADGRCRLVNPCWPIVKGVNAEPLAVITRWSTIPQHLVGNLSLSSS